MAQLFDSIDMVSSLHPQGSKSSQDGAVSSEGQTEEAKNEKSRLVVLIAATNRYEYKRIEVSPIV